MKNKPRDIILKGELKKQYLNIIPKSCPFFNYLSKLTKIIDGQQKTLMYCLDTIDLDLDLDLRGPKSKFFVWIT